MNSFIPSMSYRNILRNKRRTLLSGSTITLVAIAICLLLSFEEGAISDMQRNIIDGTTGNIRIRNQKYAENERIMPPQFYIPNTSKISAAIESLETVENVEKHISSGVSIYHDEKITTASVLGLSIANNRLFNNENTTIIDGSLPNSDTEERVTVITQALADSLNVTVGDKFTFFTRTANGGTNGATVKVGAIAYIGNTDYNGMRFFVDWKTLSHILRMNENALSLLVYTKEGVSENEIANTITRISNLPEIQNTTSTTLEIEEWQHANTMFELFSMVDIIYAYIAVVFFILASTVIFNTTMMSVLERKNEIGILMALGMEKHSITRMILFEIVLIAGVSSIIGVSIGSIVIHYWGIKGFDLNAMGGNAINGMNMSAWIYPHLALYRYIWVAALGTAISVIACIHPARKALTIEPAQALHSEN